MCLRQPYVLPLQLLRHRPLRCTPQPRLLPPRHALLPPRVHRLVHPLFFACDGKPITQLFNLVMVNECVLAVWGSMWWWRWAGGGHGRHSALLAQRFEEDILECDYESPYGPMLNDTHKVLNCGCICGCGRGCYDCD